MEMPLVFQHAYFVPNDEYNFMFFELQRGFHKPKKILNYLIPFKIKKDASSLRVNKQFIGLLAKHLFNVEGNIKEVTLREIKRAAYTTSLGKMVALLKVDEIRLYGLEEEVALHFASYITQTKTPTVDRLTYSDERRKLVGKDLPDWKFDRAFFLLKKKFSHCTENFETDYYVRLSNMKYFFEFRKE